MAVFRFTLFLFTSLVCAVVATALDYWYHQHVTPEVSPRFTLYFGLWQFCTKNVGEKAKCDSWTTIKKENNDLDISWIHACQAFMIIGVFCNVVALIGAVYVWLKGMSVKLTRGVTSICTTCYLVAVIVFGAKYYEELLKERDLPRRGLHAGFGLAVSAVLLNFVAAILAGVGQTASGYENL